MECNQLWRGTMQPIFQRIKQFTRLPFFNHDTQQHTPSYTLYEDSHPLLLAGQGTLCFKLDHYRAFSLDLIAQSAIIRLTVNQNGAKFYCLYKGRFLLLSEATSSEASLDQDPQASYWVSFFATSRTLRYGKGEPRVLTTLLEHILPASDKSPTQFWMNQITHYRINTDASVSLKKYPVTIEPAIKVLPRDQITMMDIAKGKHTVINALPDECRELYHHIAGEQFTLNTPDFPDFTDAIEASIANPDGWCHQTLLAKKAVFTQHSKTAQTDLSQCTYLRITLGENQGCSPGIPYVLEIWPSGHYSPIHKHADTNAIIRVLHGDIDVNLYSMLSIHHQQPFVSRTLQSGDITWLAQETNQVHQLKNSSAQGKACMTIQCYSYQRNQPAHYEYFDYIDPAENTIEQYYPVSDDDFISFRQRIQKEWQQRTRKQCK